MGQQQLLLIVLGVIIVGIAIVAGIGMFNAGAEEATKDELVAQSIAIGANAQQYYKKPEAMGGGGLDFTGYIIPPKMAATENGAYTLTAGDQTITITATPNANLGYTWTVSTTVDADEITASVDVTP